LDRLEEQLARVWNAVLGKILALLATLAAPSIPLGVDDGWSTNDFHTNMR